MTLRFNIVPGSMLLIEVRVQEVPTVHILYLLLNQHDSISLSLSPPPPPSLPPYPPSPLLSNLHTFNIYHLPPTLPPTEHDIPETMNLQVMCGGQVIASTEFTYYASAQYHSDLLFQYLTHTFPSYFPDVGSMGGGMGGALGQDGGGGDAGYGGGYFGGNIPSTSYSLLLGACRLGIEPLIFATLELPSMLGINRAQLTKAKDLAEEHGHMNAANVLGLLVDLPAVTVKGGEGKEDQEQILANEKSRDALKQLDNVKDNLKGEWTNLLVR